MKGNRSWKMERASVRRGGRTRSSSNKYSSSDSKGRPTAGSRSRIWIGGYTRSDGTKVHGHYRDVAP